MAADPRKFLGTALTFGTSIGRLVGLRYRARGEWINVTEPDDLVQLGEIGQPDLELVASVKRLPTVAVGDQNTISITWNDGSTTPLGGYAGQWGVVDSGGGGAENGRIDGDITFKPVVAVS